MSEDKVLQEAKCDTCLDTKSTDDDRDGTPWGFPIGEDVIYHGGFHPLYQTKGAHKEVKAEGETKKDETNTHMEHKPLTQLNHKKAK